MNRVYVVIFALNLLLCPAAMGTIWHVDPDQGNDANSGEAAAPFCFEPFSYQPLDKEPWPAQILIERNTVSFTDQGAALWGNDKLGWRPGCIKIYVTPELNTIPGEFSFRDNLVWFPTGAMLSTNQAAIELSGVRFQGNRAVARTLGGTEKGLSPKHYEFSGNQVVALTTQGAESMQAFAGPGGKLHLNLIDPGITGIDAKTGAITTKSTR